MKKYRYLDALLWQVLVFAVAFALYFLGLELIRSIGVQADHGICRIEGRISQDDCI